MLETVIKLLPAIGGIGLFLLGMSLLTDSLRKLAAASLRRIMTRFTHSPVSGAATGAVLTAVIQSSSATTVAAVSFVGAELLTFPQALGVIFGANLGTTITGWIVALVGFKLQLGQVLLPVVFLGALLRLFGSQRIKYLGTALAGFALLFIGIDAMQAGLASFEGAVTPSDFPPDTLLGRLTMVAIGMGITVVTQSSSAGVATAMVALGAGTISFPQAAALVIGMDVGTTFTAALATLGGSTNMRRTGFAHVIYNALTGALAFLLLPVYLLMAQPWLDNLGATNAQPALVAFHTIFNGIGVLAILGFTRPFARFIERLIPERGPALTRHLDTRLLSDGTAASQAAFTTTRDIAMNLAAILEKQMAVRDGGGRYTVDLNAVAEAIGGLTRFLERLHAGELTPAARQQHIAVLHALDHIERLLNRCRQFQRIDVLDEDETLHQLSGDFSAAIHAFAMGPLGPSTTQSFDLLRKRLRKIRKTYRVDTLGRVSAGDMDGEGASDRLDAVRWLHRSAYHFWRLALHLEDQTLPITPRQSDVHFRLDA